MSDLIGDYLAQLWRELKTQGVDISRSLVAEWAAPKRKQIPYFLSTPKDGVGSPRRAVIWTPRRASWLFVKPQEELEDEEMKVLERIHHTDSQMEEAYSLGQLIAELCRRYKTGSASCHQRTEFALEQWATGRADQSLETYQTSNVWQG